MVMYPARNKQGTLEESDNEIFNRHLVRQSKVVMTFACNEVEYFEVARSLTKYRTEIAHIGGYSRWNEVFPDGETTREVFNDPELLKRWNEGSWCDVIKVMVKGDYHRLAPFYMLPEGHGYARYTGREVRGEHYNESNN